MPGRISRLAAALALSTVCAVPSPALASAAAAKAPAPKAPVTQIHLGDSLVALNGPWKFTIGDSPVDPATGKALWAEPGFNDSAWENVDLTPASGSIDPIAGTSEYQPGWTAKGHPGYWGYAWYRIRVHIETPPGVKLALAGPSDVDDIYQAFDDGVMVGEFGDFTGSTPAIYTTRPEMFLLPANHISGDVDHVLAFRVFMEPYTLSQLDDVGGFHNPPLIGEQSAVAARNQVKWDELYRSYAGNLVELVLFALLGVIAFSLTLFDRDDPVYLWIGALLLLIAVGATINLFSTWTEWIPYWITAPFRLAILTPFIYVGWVMVWRVWFRLRRPRWMPWAVLVLLPLLIITSSIGQNLFFVLVPARIESAFHVASLIVRLAVAALLLLTVIQGILEQGLEGLIAVPPVLLAGVAEFSAELNFFHIVPNWFPFGFQFSTRQLANLLLVAALALLLLRRLTKSIRHQRQIALDVKQAQEVQQVILPEQRAVIPGFEIESEYRPALEVGGDFFQVIPIATDNSVLIVAGDVAGKGLKAGMLVALLVGAIRTAAQFDPDPMAVLGALNQRLRGRGEAFATCLALRISSTGEAELANAGHPSPYLNGKPVDIEGSLPLGMVESPEFTLRRFLLAPGDRLLMLSDGVAEAKDASGQLLGFDRVQILLRRSKSAAEIADAAQAFGQEDDISVIAVTRVAVPEPAAA
ncbi:MAG TPA: SpoIIE family protein phosphatase [Terracidiphilus sp.]|nr:SpoIIE family protein phosphatase [Terracidiphilus sp.]